MLKRKRDHGVKEGGSSECPPPKAVKYNPTRAPVQKSPESEEDSNWPKVVRRRTGGRLDRRILYVRAPRGKKKGGTAGVVAAGENVCEENEDEHAGDVESGNDDEEEGDEDEGEEEENDNDGEEEGKDEIIITTRLDEPEDNGDHIEVTVEALEHRLLGIGRQTKSVPPNQLPQPWPLSREREAALIALHVQPFRNPSAVSFATSTGAQKHIVPKGVSLDTSYTPNLERIYDNTGSRKGAWDTGVDPDTAYAGDVILFPTVDCVSKGIDLRRVLVSDCDEEKTAVNDAPPAKVNDQPAAPKDIVAFALPSDIPGTQVFPSLGRKVVRLAFSSLKTSEQPTFERGMKLPWTKHEALGAVPFSQEERFILSVPIDSPSLESIALMPHPVTHTNMSPTLQAIIQGSGIPRSLHELEIIVEGLAEGLGLAPEPSYLDMRGGRKFDLDREMARYSLPFIGCHREPVDYTARLLSLLNIQGC